MLIVTAGHIDHGKSTLVRALTGVDTDRLPEEKARGISIDLGFAYWPQPGGGMIGFVDVPGHERYVRNMLAGVGGADAALIVVAADDGVMPQTIEHVRILDLLGISRGFVALTKADRVSEARLGEVLRQVAALLGGTVLAGAPAFPVSALSGEGVAALAAALRAAAEGLDAARAAADAPFRLAIDRSFTVTGAGTVVTGTVRAGRVAPGEQLVLAPLGRMVRVRSLQSASAETSMAAAGMRCAIGLAGIEAGEVHRGDWLVPVALAAPTQRIEARIAVLPAREAALRHGATVHLHHGTATMAARVLMPSQRAIGPGESAVATLALDAPTLAANGERFVLRDAAGRELIGGGRVIDPFAPLRRRRDCGREAVLAALERHEAGAALAGLLGIAGHEIDAAWFVRSFALAEAEAEDLFAAAGARRIGPGRALAEAAIAAHGEAIVAALAACHHDEPERGGLTRRELRARLAPAPSAEVLSALLRELGDARRIEFAGPLLRLTGHAAQFGKVEIAMWQALLAEIGDGAPRVVAAPELARLLRASEATVRAMLYRRRINGDLWALDDSRFMTREHVAALAASAAAIAREGPGALTAARFRDATGIGRNHVIRILEFLDRIGVTARRGDARVVKADHAAITGIAEPWLVTG